MGFNKRKVICIFTTLISVLFLNNLDVNAEDYSNLIYHDSSIFTWTNGTTQSVVPDNTYYKDTSSYLYILRDKIYFFDNAYADETSLSSGSYIMDYYIYGVVSSNNTCDTLELTMAYVDGAGSTFTANVDCIGVEKTKMYGLDATHIYMKFTLKTPAWFITNNIKSIYSFVYPTTNNAMNYGFSIGTIQTYTSEAYNSIINTIKQNNANQTIIDQNTQTNSKLDEQIEQNKEIINQQKETNDYITDDTEPNADISALGNVQGLLPEGPVDSLLNIPFMFLSVITSSMGGVCVPMEFNFVFDSSLTLPCFSEQFYGNVPDLLLNFLSLIPSAFILIKYFKHLYKKVDRAVSMDSNADDQWGAI